MNPVTEEIFVKHAQEDRDFQLNQAGFNERQEEFNAATLAELKAIRALLEPLVKVFAEGKSWTRMVVYFFGFLIFLGSLIGALTTIWGFLNSLLHK